MTETQIQSLIVLAKQIVLAIIGVLIASAGVLLGFIPDDSTRYLAGLILVPFLNGIAKLIGGATQAVERQVGRGAAGSIKRPSFLSV